VGSLSLPVGVYDETLPVKPLEGRVRERAWRVPSPNLTTLRVIQGLRTDLTDGGYEVILDCDAAACGGFDFRFGIPVLPAPAMNVDLFDYRVITARKALAGREEHVYLLVSRGRTDRYIQVMEVVTANPGGALPVLDLAPEAGTVRRGPDAPEDVPTDDLPSGLIAALTSTGHVVLNDLDFPTGAGGLKERDYPTLEALATYLKGDVARVVAVVGHTDAVGALDANVALSQRRAEAVRQRLITRYGVPGAQVQAQGAGYMAPVASNLTAEGREANRRVEAVLLAAE
jgi:OOP family OmpA-OmpF porin